MAATELVVCTTGDEEFRQISTAGISELRFNLVGGEQSRSSNDDGEATKPVDPSRKYITSGKRIQGFPTAQGSNYMRINFHL